MTWNPQLILAGVVGAVVFIALVLSQILPGRHKSEWMGWVLLAYLAGMAILLFGVLGLIGAIAVGALVYYSTRH